MLENLLHDLMAFKSGQMPVLTATLDLRPGAVGARPPAPTIANQAVSDEIAPREYRSADATASLAAAEERLQASIEAAIREGAQGLMFVGCAGEDFSRELLTGEPLRNSVRVGNAPWLFELVRFRALHGTSAMVVFVDLHTMEAVRITQGESSPVATVDYDAHLLTKGRGRTGVHGQSGAVASKGGSFGSGPVGGHAKNRIENQVEEHRAMFAREAAAELARKAGPGDVLIVAGVTEARSLLLGELPQDLADRAIEHPAVGEAPGGRSGIARLAMDLVVERQYESAERLLASAPPDQVVSGPGPLLSALESGRIVSLVIHEDAVGHLGYCEDARPQGRRDGEDDVDRAIRLAFDTSADVRFTRAPHRLEEQQGMIGVRRW